MAIILNLINLRLLKRKLSPRFLLIIQKCCHIIIVIFIDFEKEILGIVSSWKIWEQGEICALLNIFIEVTVQSVKLNFFYSVYKPDLPEAFISTLRKLLTQCLLSHWSPKAEVSVDCQKAGIAGFLVSLEPFKGND